MRAIPLNISMGNSSYMVVVGQLLSNNALDIGNVAYVDTQSDSSFSAYTSVDSFVSWVALGN